MSFCLKFFGYSHKILKKVCMQSLRWNHKILLNTVPFKRLFLLILFLYIYSPQAFGITVSITDPGFSSEKPLEKSFFWPLQGSVKTRLSRSLRRGNWKDFFSPAHADNLFDTLFIKTDFSLNYPLSEIFPSLKESSLFHKMLLSFVLNYSRPLYDTPEIIKWHCFKTHFCFGETSVGISNSLPEKNLLKSQYSVYLNIPFTSRKSIDQKKFVGISASMNMNYPLVSKTDFKISGISSHFFDTAVYGSRYANKQGSKWNDIFSVFNQVGLRFSYSGKPFIPAVLTYISHLVALDYHTDWFHGLSLGFSTVWAVGKRIQIVAGFSWGGAIYRDEFTDQAKEADPFNPDETFINGGFSYSF